MVEKTIKSTQTAIDIMESIADGETLTVSEIAGRTNYSRSTIHYHLKTLQNNRYVIQEDGGYRLGLKMSQLGETALQHQPLNGIVDRPLTDLAEEAGGIAQVVVEESGKAVTLKYAAEREVSNVTIERGRETDMHCTAYGQAILAYLPEDDREKIITREDLSEYTQKTLTNEDELRDRLDTVREVGFAYSSEEYAPGISSIALPIGDQRKETVVGSIGITDHTENVDVPYKHAKARRFSEELPNLLRKYSDNISNNLYEE